jgi:hypothetical protein
MGLLGLDGLVCYNPRLGRTGEQDSFAGQDATRAEVVSL